MIESKNTKRYYADKIVSLYPDMSKETIASHCSRLKCTYEELYEDLKERLEVIDKAQDMFIQVEPRELKNLKEFKDKIGSRRNEFINCLYRHREQIPPKKFVNRIKRVIKQWENQEDICKSCIHYNSITSFCNYLDTQTPDDFFCKAFERDEDL